MSRFFKGTVAALALAAVTGMPFAALAQTAPAEAPAATAPATTAATTLPKALQDLNLSDVQTKDGKRGGKRVEGKLSDGTELKAILDDQGNLRGAFIDDQKALPQSLVDQLIPDAVRSQDLMQQFATVTGAFNNERGVMVGGVDANGEKLRAGFTADGTLMRFGRGDDEGPGKHDRHHGKGRHGDKGDRGDRHGHGERPAPLTDEAVTKAVTDAGYTDLGDITRDGPRTTVSAKNPQGEAVTVEVTPRGEVVRETAQ